MVNKLGQMKIQQMAFMLIAIMMFFALVGLLIITVTFSGLKEKATELNEKNARLLVTKLANSPEFSCGSAFGTRRVSCIDADKVMALRGNIKDYESFWGVSNIEIWKIYPNVQGEVECTQGNYQECNKITLVPGEIIGRYIGNFVALCRKEVENGKTYDKCELAKIFVSYEEVQ